MDTPLDTNSRECVSSVSALWYVAPTGGISGVRAGDGLGTEIGVAPGPVGAPVGDQNTGHRPAQWASTIVYRIVMFGSMVLSVDAGTMRLR